MAKANERKSLGRGLSSIIATTGASKDQKIPLVSTVLASEKSLASFSHNLFSEVLIEKIIASPYQARKEFSQESIEELAESISQEGLLQPIVLRKVDDNTYEIIAGERRWRACKHLGMKRIIANVQKASDSSAAVKGLIENLQRSDLNPMEEALGYANLMANFKLTQDSISSRVGKARSSVANSLRLLTLSKDIQQYISSGLISMGHAKVLLGINSTEHRSLLARKIIETGINVRATEELAHKIKYQDDKISPSSKLNQSMQDAVLKQIEDKLRERLSANIQVKATASKKGKIMIDYMDNDDLERILAIIGVVL
ncbi:MAG: ParB/RepB/Spo0J family partition protein [Opitutales bacterium]